LRPDDQLRARLGSYRSPLPPEARDTVLRLLRDGTYDDVFRSVVAEDPDLADKQNQPPSLGAQETRLSEFVTSQPGWEQVKTYTDQFSGPHAERPVSVEALRGTRLGHWRYGMIRCMLWEDRIPGPAIRWSRVAGRRRGKIGWKVTSSRSSG